MPSFPEIHPEFGYFAPGGELRRKLRLVLATAGVGALLGAAGVLALVTPRADPATQEMALAAAPAAVETAEVAPAPATAPEAPPAAAPQVTRSISTPEGTPATKSCKEQTWPYLDQSCLTSRASKSRKVRVLPPDAPSQHVAPAGSVAGDVIDRTDSAAASAKKPERSAQRRTKKRNRDRSNEANPRSAYAGSYGYDRGGYYGGAPRNRDGWDW